MELTSGSSIFSVSAREILDSRANPTIETTVILNSGYRGTASVPSGASVGKHEAVELRDGDESRYNGMGVQKAIQNIHSVIAGKLKGYDALKQKDIDDLLNSLDGTPHKSKLGANAILSVSLAVCRAASAHARIPLYQYVNKIVSGIFPIHMKRIPIPLFNMINGGKHGGGNLNFQEFFVIPQSSLSFKSSLAQCVDAYNAIKHVLEYRNAVHALGDEGGFAPNLFTNEDALEVIRDAVQSMNRTIGTDLFLGADIAASYFLTEKGYLIKDKPEPYSCSAFIEYLMKLKSAYGLILLEDPIEEDDWNGWKEITAKMGESTLIVGDDLIVSSYERLKKAITEKACTAVVIKPNQIGTLSELIDTVVLAKQSAIRCIVAHRSGETNDPFIADLAVAVQSDFVKFGAPARGERVAKYNRLLEIESELGFS